MSYLPQVARSGPQVVLLNTTHSRPEKAAIGNVNTNTSSSKKISTKDRMEHSSFVKNMSPRKNPWKFQVNMFHAPTR